MSSSLERATDTLKDLQNEISKSELLATTAGQKPLLVEVRQPEPKGLDSIANRRSALCYRRWRPPRSRYSS